MSFAAGQRLRKESGARRVPGSPEQPGATGAAATVATANTVTALAAPRAAPHPRPAPPFPFARLCDNAAMNEFDVIVEREHNGNWVATGWAEGSGAAPEEPRERAVLVGVTLPHMPWSMESTLAELERLADTAGADVVGVVTQKLDAPNPRTYVGSGKAKEIRDLVQECQADLVIFDEELTPTQQANLEKAVGKDIKVIDRTALILDIFALHATSKEGRLQVRLAQNKYLLPRLRGMWAHLASNHMGGGVGSRFGEGESQLEIDRRIVRNRISAIKQELAHLGRVRATQRETRYASGIAKVSLAGYTNAGKSSLLNRLTDADVLSYDKLFATLDSTTRQFALPEGRRITLTDTVGFIQKLPTTLIEAFKSTLDEITGSDLILHVVDASSPDRAAQMTAVSDILGQIGAGEIPTVLVFNKCDNLIAEELEELQEQYPAAEFISALTGEGVESLIARLAHDVAASDAPLTVVLPYSAGALASLAHQHCRILAEEFAEDGTHLTLIAPRHLAPQFAAFAVDAASTPDADANAE